jgi:hypothetical protein
MPCTLGLVCYRLIPLLGLYQPHRFPPCSGIYSSPARDHIGRISSRILHIPILAVPFFILRSDCMVAPYFATGLGGLGSLPDWSRTLPILIGQVLALTRWRTILCLQFNAHRGPAYASLVSFDCITHPLYFDKSSFQSVSHYESGFLSIHDAFFALFGAHGSPRSPWVWFFGGRWYACQF